MTRPHLTVAGATLGITRRTSCRKLFWTPSSPLVHQGWLYALGLAQTQLNVAVHHGTLMGTHEHLTLTPREANHGRVFRLLHRESARYVQEYLLAHGYDAPQEVWDDRHTHRMRLLDVGAQLQWLVYSHLNCVDSGLVERVSEYPGFVSDLGLLKGGVIAVKRPPLYFSKEVPAEIELRFTPPPDLERAFAGELDGMVHWLGREVRVREDELRRERRESGQRALGAGVVKKIHPFAEPRTPRESRGRRIPRFKIGGSMSDPAVRAIVEQCNAEQDGFWAEHEAQRRRWVAGERGAVFPYGTYGMRANHGARVAESPPADAILAAAGAVAGEVDVRSLLEEMRDERRRETAETVTDLRELAAPASESTENDTAPSAKDDGTRAEATAVELESPARSSRREHARRVVTLRTRRRGKPRTPT